MLRITSVLVVIGCLGSHTALAQWPTDGRALSNAINTQHFPAIAPDGIGGAIVTWQDHRAGNNDDIYAQRVGANGVIKWTVDGVAVCNPAVTNQQHPAIATDGNRGAIIVWSDFRDNVQFDIFAQRLDSLGTGLWGANGKTMGAFGDAQINPVIVSDGAGGAIYASEDWRAGNADIYSNRIDGNGNLLWSLFGIAVCTASGTQNLIQVIPDGLGGAVFAWQDFRGVTQLDIFAQRINSSGVVQWAANGNQCVNTPEDQLNPSLCTDGTGGAIITWQDFRSGHNNIYAQRYNAAGVMQWALNGVVVCGATTGQALPVSSSDGSGGAIIAWQDLRGTTGGDIYAQRVSPTGTMLWAPDGVPVCSAASLQSNPVIVRDGGTGAIVAWRDFRNGAANGDLYAQRVNSTGAPVWTANGIALCTEPSSQTELVATYVNSGAGGIVAAWTDPRNGPTDIYAMSARSPVVAVGGTPAAPGLVLRNYPNPFTGSTVVDIEISRTSDVSIDVFDVAGRRVKSLLLPNRVAGVHQFAFDGVDDSGWPLASGVYFCRVTAGGSTASRKLLLVR